jgi:hypothetical protein
MVMPTSAGESVRPVPPVQRSGRDDTRHCLHFGGARVRDCQLFAVDGHIADEVKLIAITSSTGKGEVGARALDEEAPGTAFATDQTAAICAGQL